MTPTLKSPLPSRYLTTWALVDSSGAVGGIGGGGGVKGFPCSPGDWWGYLMENWTQVFGSDCLYMALWTGGVCHGHLEASECQGVGLVTRD